MKIFRIVVGMLAIFPVLMLGYSILSPSLAQERNSLFDLVFLCFGLPILVLNYWAWFEPEIVGKLFNIKEREH